MLPCFVYIRVAFRGNRFIPDSAIRSMSEHHGLDGGEYELLRLGWPEKKRQRDGAVGWLFDVLENYGETCVLLKNVTKLIWATVALVAEKYC